MPMDKKALRQWVRTQKRLHTPDQLARESVQVCRRVMALPAWQQARCVLLYHALPDEVDTRLLLADALAQSKRVVLPVVSGDDLLLRFYDGHTRPGAFGIAEPVGSLLTDYSQIDLALIPGMAFDAAGHRLGRGKGYYDRLLPRLACPRLGICFSFQQVPSLPTEPHDVGMDSVV